MVLAARPVFYRIPAAVQRAEQPVKGLELPAAADKVVLQPRLCTLRSYGGERGGVIKARSGDEVSRFFERLSDYIESSNKSHDFEIISGRLAMD